MILGVPYHELVIASIMGLIFGVLGYFVTRAISPHIESAVKGV